jgi:hypothetical protein
MSWVVGLANNSYKPITNTVWVRARLCKLQKRCTRLTDASDKVYQLLVHGRWFSPASSTTKTGRHDIAEILLKVALSTIKIKSNQRVFVPKGSSKLHPLHNCSSKFRLTVYVEILQSLLVVLSFFYLRLLITSLVSTNLSYIIINDLFQSNIAFQPRSYGMQSWNLIPHKWSLSIIKLR